MNSDDDEMLVLLRGVLWYVAPLGLFAIGILGMVAMAAESSWRHHSMSPIWFLFFRPGWGHVVIAIHVLRIICLFRSTISVGMTFALWLITMPLVGGMSMFIYEVLEDSPFQGNAAFAAFFNCWATGVALSIFIPRGKPSLTPK